jgi:hypothetical protein
MLVMSSPVSEEPASQRVSPAVTSVAMTTSPDSRAGSSPPATPKLITPLNVEESMVASKARNCSGLLPLQITIRPEPAAIRASCTKPVTIKTGRCGDFLLSIAVIGDIAISRVIGQLSRFVLKRTTGGSFLIRWHSLWPFSSLLKNPKNWAFILSRVPLLG